MSNIIYKKDVNLFLKDEKVPMADLIVADPPYNMNMAEWDTFKSNDEFMEFSIEWIKNSFNKLNDGGTFYIFNNSLNSALLLSEILRTISEANFVNWITWYKKDGFSSTKRRYVNNQETIIMLTKNAKLPKTFNHDDIRTPYKSGSRMEHAKKSGIKMSNGKYWYPNPNGSLTSDVWEFTSHRHKNKVGGKPVKELHPTIKPKDMIERIIKASSNEGDVVYDLFSGSGMTTKVSKELSRNSYGCELEQKYIDEYAKEFLSNED